PFLFQHRPHSRGRIFCENVMRSQLKGTVTIRAASAFALLLFCVSQVRAAEEPSGCDKFKWNIDHERAALTASDRAKLTSGSELTAMPSTGMILSLRPPADAKLPTPPERAPKDGTFAGFTSIKAAP